MCPVLPNEINKILSEETEAEQPVSEAVVQKIGKNINALIDRTSNREEFLANGNFTVPEGINRIVITGAGGGGGGGGNSGTGAGWGGDGAIPTSFVISVVEEDVYTVTIGTGGAGGVGNSDGADGGSTILTGPGGTFTFYGAYGGPFASIAAQGTANRLDSFLYARGGQGGNGVSVGGQNGAPSVYASGGSYGATPAGFASKSGGGGAGRGAGGNGGGTASAGASAAANSSAGGGGGNDGNGGAGGSGYLLISW